MSQRYKLILPEAGCHRRSPRGKQEDPQQLIRSTYCSFVYKFRIHVKKMDYRSVYYYSVNIGSTVSNNTFLNMLQCKHSYQC